MKILFDRLINLVIPLSLTLLFGACTPTSGESLRIYPAPAGEPLSADFRMEVNGQNVPVYLATVATEDPVKRVKIFVPNDTSYADHASFGSFDLAGAAEITVICPGSVTNVKLSPAASGIKTVVAGSRITFSVSRPQQLALEVNGDWVHALQIFVNPLETNIPGPNDPGVIYFGPGIHEVDGVVVDSGKTVYVAGGAVVRGVVKPGVQAGATFFLRGSNIKFRGRGIIDGSRCPSHTRSLLALTGTNLSVEGVTLRDSSGWTVPMRGSEHVSVSNIKLFGVRANSDGIDICNSRHVSVADCYLRTMDDLVVVKTPVRGGGESADIDVRRCVLWNELAHALSIGAELRDNVERVHFADCDIIHDKGREWLLRVYHCDAADVHDVTFENIRIEESRRLLSLWIGEAIWSKDAERGHIERVTFRDIHAVGPSPIIELKGGDARHKIQNVRFENIEVNGRDITAADVRQNEFVTGVKVTGREH